MTKEELIEDVSIGDIVKIYTKSDEVSEGQIADFGASGLKISLIGSGRAKRIMYDRITEYEVESDCFVDPEPQDQDTKPDDTEVFQAETENSQPADQDNEKDLSDLQKTDIPHKIIYIDRKSLFKDSMDNIDIESIREFWKNKTGNRYKNEYLRICDILAYAKKVHEYTLNSDRVRRAIAQYKKLAETDKGFYAFIALIYHELGDYQTAISYYHKAGAFDTEFMLVKKYHPDQNLFDLAVLAIKYNEENAAIVKWLCEYAVEKDNVAVISYLIEHTDASADQALLYWYADKAQLQSVPDRDDLFAKENIQYLKEICMSASAEDDAIPSVLASAVYEEREEVKEVKEVPAEEEEEVYKGIISYYNRNGGNGTIKCLNGGSISFYIRQVRDLELQKILATKYNYKRRVTYTRGINFKGIIAADAIEYDGDDWKEKDRLEGFVDDYDSDNGFGRICSGKEFYNFSFKNITDPLLYAEIISRPYILLNLEVIFYVRDYESKRTKKVTRIADDIVGKKVYSQDEINDFISQGFVTKNEVYTWLATKEEKSAGSFKAVPYEPLRPIVSYSHEDMEVRQHQHPAKKIELTKSMEPGRYENRAIDLILPQNEKNPFLELKKDNGGGKYFQRAHQYMVGKKNYAGDITGVDLAKAEELFIKSIQANDQTASAVANLANVYVKLGGAYIVKGLQLLEAYGYLLTSDKVTNLQIQLIDKSGNNEALELILLEAIPKCVKKNTVWQYMVKLAQIYYRNKDWKKAIEWFEKSLNYLDQNKVEFIRYAKLRMGNLRTLIIANYNAGNRQYASMQAKEYLEGMPEDPVMRSILNGSFELDETKTVMEDLEEMDLQYEDEFYAEDSGELSQYLTDRLQEVDLSSTFNKVNDVYSKTQDGVFIGNSSDVKRVVEFIQTAILRRNKIGLGAGYRSTIYIGIAKIIYDSRNNKNIDNNSKLAIDEVKKFVGRYARYTADALVEKYATIDSIRYMYIQALKYLDKEDDGNIIAATNMLVASFFTEGRTLTDELHEMKAKVYNYNYYCKPCISAKDLLIATFMLQEKQEYVNRILNKVYESPDLRNCVIQSVCRMVSQNNEVASFYDFESLWKTAKGRYYTIIEKIGKEVADSVNEYHMVESIRQHVIRIEELMSEKMLWNQDESILCQYLKILSSIGNTFDKYTVEEKIDGFLGIESEIDKLKAEITNAPTELSYDYIFTRLDDLKYVIRGQFDDLYQSSRPECEIFLSNNSVYVNEKTVEIAITVRNAEDKQDADAVTIELEGSQGAAFLRCEKRFTSIRSGEEQDYMAVFSLGNRVIMDGQFEVTVKMQYRYRESVENIKTIEMTEILPVNIIDKENFAAIENKYNRIIRGTGVDVKTPELFKGRNDLIDSICASLSSNAGIMTKNRGIILWGQRRVGKNSVKDYLKEKIKSEYPQAYLVIELGSIGKCRNLREVLMTIIDKTEDTLMTEYEDVYDRLMELGMEFRSDRLEKTEYYMPEFSRFMDRFSARIRKISESEKNIPLYFLDEFSYLYEWIEKGNIDGKEFMRFWKSFIQDYGICAIIIAQDNIPVWKSRYENEFACMNHDNEITYLNFEGAKELICEPCQTDGKVLFAPDAVKLIYDWTKGSAYLIVIFCKHVIDYLNDNYTEKATKTIVQIVFEKEFVEKKEMFKSDDFEPQIQDVANVGQEGERINQLNEKLLKEIAGATITASQVKIEELNFFTEYEKEQAFKIFNRLKDRKIIEVERDTYCSISMPLLKLYLLREQSLLNRDILNKLTR